MGPGLIEWQDGGYQKRKCYLFRDILKLLIKYIRMLLIFTFLSTSEWSTVLILTHPGRSDPKFNTGRVVSYLDFSMKNNTASILKSTRVPTIPSKRNCPCACPINYSSGYSGKHINSLILACCHKKVLLRNFCDT